MENNATYHFLKLFLENLWPIVGLIVVLLVWVNRTALSQELPKYVSKLKIGELEMEFREVKEQLEETKTQVAVLENDLEQERTRFLELAAGFNPHAPVAELEGVRQAIRAEAGSLNDLAPVFDGLKPGATANQIYAAAVAIRQLRNPQFFDPLVACLDRLANDKDLQGIRLHTVWTLTSALHKILIAEFSHKSSPSLTAGQLRAAMAMLDKLVVNPRVLQDRPDDPEKGVRGPAKWSANWIEKGLVKLAVQ